MRAFPLEGVALCLSALLACSCSPPAYPAARAHPLLGQPLPSLQHRQTLAGRSLDLGPASGKPVLIKFFADYCGPCKKTLPVAEHIHQFHPEMLVVGIDEDERSEVAEAMVERLGLTFPVVHDGGNVLSGRFHVTTMPMSFVADASGTIRWVGGEEQTEEDLRRAVEASR